MASDKWERNTWIMANHDYEVRRCEGNEKGWGMETRTKTWTIKQENRDTWKTIQDTPTHTHRGCGDETTHVRRTIQERRNTCDPN